MYFFYWHSKKNSPSVLLNNYCHNQKTEKVNKWRKLCNKPITKNYLTFFDGFINRFIIYNLITLNPESLYHSFGLLYFQRLQVLVNLDNSNFRGPWLNIEISRVREIEKLKKKSGNFCSSHFGLKIIVAGSFHL